jgi:hypothetical protein
LKYRCYGLIGLLGLAFFGGCAAENRAPSLRSSPVQSSPAKASIEYRAFDLTYSRVHVLRIPAQGAWEVVPVVAATPASVAAVARQHDVIAAINAGFFDPQNFKTTSYIIQDGEIVADPQENERLIGNPELQEQLPAILNRSEWRRYDCSGKIEYTIALRQDPIRDRCTLQDAIGAGPQLLPTLTAGAEGFITKAGDRLIRDAIGTQQRNARSAVGILANGDLVFVVVAQKPELTTPSGMTLAELAAFLQELGVVEALNLDGGSSSGLYYQNHTYFGKFDAQANPIERPIKSVLIIRLKFYRRTL